MPLIDNVLAEIGQEARTTRKVLAAVPADRLEWAPHAKSMTLGRLAWHIATVPAFVAGAVGQDGFDFASAGGPPPVPATTGEILAGFDRSLEAVRGALTGLSDEKALAPWTLSRGGQVIMTLPRIGFVRTILLNHTYHHRGQLSVYLRLLDVPVPSIYGPSADENPFG